MKIVLVRADDWEGLYVDGLLQSENHSVDPRVLLDLVGGSVVYLTSSQDKALCDVGRFPPALCDLEAELGK